jgi:glycosyltransferase involved in cell wall biosynthesis
MPQDQVIVVDDNSKGRTVEIARNLPLAIIHRHERNKGYGGNEKSCYNILLKEKGDIIVMVHPDYRYTPKLIPAIISMIGSGLYHCVLGSRILGGYALKGGMPLWRYISNRILTLIGNLLMKQKISDYRAFSRELLETLPYEKNSDDFVFDNQMLAQILWMDYTIAEASCPTSYATDSSSINFIPPKAVSEATSMKRHHPVHFRRKSF